MDFVKPRGTIDYINLKDPSFDIVCDKCDQFAKSIGFSKIKTPIFEQKNLFIRSVGDMSDIVNKQLFEFIDKHNRQMVLRPELTASVCRATIENKLINSTTLPIKFYYIEPMFRYERPQSGRLRIFHQFGVEYIGSNSIYDDIDAINLAISILKMFNLKKYELHINNICSIETRSKWIESLKKYFSKYENQLTEDSKKRLAKNPLRILDDKIDGSKPFVKNAPKIIKFASKDEIKYFDKIKTSLKEIGINFIVDETLVRGLDYYCNFIFEIVSTSKLLKGQSTLIGGGRYNNLLKELGSKEDVNCLGFALGIERLLIALNDDNTSLNELIKNYRNIDVCIACLTDDARIFSLKIAQNLIRNNISYVINHNTDKLVKHFKYASEYNAKFVVIIGNNEIKKRTLLIKNQKTMKQIEIKDNKLIEYLINKIKCYKND